MSAYIIYIYAYIKRAALGLKVERIGKNAPETTRIRSALFAGYCRPIITVYNPIGDVSAQANLGLHVASMGLGYIGLL